MLFRSSAAKITMALKKGRIKSVITGIKAGISAKNARPAPNIALNTEIFLIILISAAILFLLI